MTANDDRYLFAGRLDEALLFRRIQKQDLAKMIGVHRTSLSKILSGDREVSIIELKAMSEALKVRAEWLLWGSDLRYGVKEGEQWL